MATLVAVAARVALKGVITNRVTAVLVVQRAVATIVVASVVVSQAVALPLLAAGKASHPVKTVALPRAATAKATAASQVLVKMLRVVLLPVATWAPRVVQIGVISLPASLHFPSPQVANRLLPMMLASVQHALHVNC